MPYLYSARSKLERGNQHRACLRKAIDSYSCQQQGNVGRYTQSSTGNDIFKLDRSLEEPPPNMAVTIGDALFNYRSALDHLMQALVVHSGSEPNSRTQFPIFEQSERFHHGGKDQMKGTHPVIAAIIELQQKFTNVYPSDGDNLWKLHRLHNLDKHQRCHQLTVVCEGVLSSRCNPDLSRLGQRADRDPDLKSITPQCPLRTGVILATVPKKYAIVPFTAQFELAFAGGEIGSREMVRYVIGGIAGTVESIIDQFTRLFFDYDSSALGRLYKPLHKEIDALRGILGRDKRGGC